MWGREMDETLQKRRRKIFVIIKTAKLVFTSIIRTQLGRQDLKGFLNVREKKETIERLKVDHVLTEEQFDLLYPRLPDVPELEKFDIALLIVIIRTFFCSVTHDNEIWYKGNKPDSRNTSLEADIIRLRDLKNDIQEVEEGQIDTTWTNISKIFVRLGRAITDLRMKIDTFTEESYRLSGNVEDEVDESIRQWDTMEKHFEHGFDLSPSETKTMRFKLNSLIMDGGRIVLKSLLDCLIPPNSLPNKITINRRRIAFYLDKKIIKQSQYDILFPSVGRPTSNDFDISLIMVFFRNFCGLRRYDDGCWDPTYTPAPNDWSKEADIVRIRNYRNEISHLSKASVIITKEDFESKWEDITQVLLRLNETRFEDTHMKEEFDRLKCQPLDPEKAEMLERELDAWIKMDEKCKLDITKQIHKQSLHGAAMERSRVAVDNVIPDDIFVKTRQYEDAKRILAKNGIIVVSGAPGEGKSTLAKKLLKELAESENKKYIKFDSHTQWEYVVLEDIDIVFIDDMFGEGCFDKVESRKWQKHIPTMSKLLKSRKIQIIITSRSYILEEAKDKVYVDHLFSEDDIYTLASKNLEREEKKDILANHFKSLNRNDNGLINDILDIDLDEFDASFKIGFPECARLFSSKNELFDAKVDFFKCPMTHVKSCMSDLFNDDDTFVAFFVLWAQPSQTIVSKDVELSVDETKKTKSEIILPIQKLQFRAGEHLRKIRYTLLKHKGGFIRYDEEQEKFTFSHRVIRDAVGLVSYERNPTAVLEHCDLDFIKNCVRVEHGCNERIYLSPIRYDQLSRRIRKLALSDSSLQVQGAENAINPNEIYMEPSIFLCKIFEQRTFCSAFLETLTSDETLLDLLVTTVRTVKSEFAEFRFLEKKIAEGKILLPSFLILNQRHFSTFCEMCLETLCEQSPQHFSEELNMAMMFAVKHGNCDALESLVRKDGICNIEMIGMAILRNDEKMYQCLRQYVCSETPIMHAFCKYGKYGYEEVVEKLLQRGENVHRKDINGNPPLYEAVTNRNFSLVKTLLKHDPSQINMKLFRHSQKSVDLLYWSVISDQENILKLIINMGMFSPRTDEGGATYFCLAISQCQIKSAKILLQNAVENKIQSEPDERKNTPLLLALKNLSSREHLDQNVRTSWFEIANKLCEFPDKINLQNAEGEMALQIACREGYVPIVNKIIAHGTVFEDSTIFHYFVKEGDTKCIETLLKSEIDPNILDARNRTPFMFANVMGKKLVAQVLTSDSRIVQYNREMGIVMTVDENYP